MQQKVFLNQIYARPHCNHRLYIIWQMWSFHWFKDVFKITLVMAAVKTFKSDQIDILFIFHCFVFICGAPASLFLMFSRICLCVPSCVRQRECALERRFIIIINEARPEDIELPFFSLLFTSPSSSSSLRHFICAYHFIPSKIIGAVILYTFVSIKWRSDLQYALRRMAL